MFTERVLCCCCCSCSYEAAQLENGTEVNRPVVRAEVAGMQVGKQDSGRTVDVLVLRMTATTLLSVPAAHLAALADACTAASLLRTHSACFSTMLWAR